MSVWNSVIRSTGGSASQIIRVGHEELASRVTMWQNSFTRSFHHHIIAWGFRNATQRKHFPFVHKRREKKSPTQELAAAESLRIYNSPSAGGVQAELRHVRCGALQNPSVMMETTRCTAVCVFQQADNETTTTNMYEPKISKSDIKYYYDIYMYDYIFCDVYTENFLTNHRVKEFWK